MSRKSVSVVFIHGFRKTIHDWDITTGGRISISKTIHKTAETILVGITETDYQKSITEVCTTLMSKFPTNQIILVGHSYGCLYATNGSASL